VLGACGPKLVGGDAQRRGGVIDVQRGALQQLGGDQAGAGVAAGVGVAVGARKLAAGHVAGRRLEAAWRVGGYWAMGSRHMRQTSGPFGSAMAP
jgi:hypothetical protein